MSTNNETARKIGQKVAIGLAVVEGTAVKLAEVGVEKTKKGIEKGKSFINGLISGFKEVRDISKVQAQAIQKAVEEHKLDIENQ